MSNANSPQEGLSVNEQEVSQVSIIDPSSTQDTIDVSSRPASTYNLCSQRTNYSTVELMHLLNIIEDILSIGPDE